MAAKRGVRVVWVIEAVLFLAPIAAFVWWRRVRPSEEPSQRLLLAACVGLGLALAGALWFGFGRSLPRGSVYVPAVLGPEGRVVPGRTEPAR